MKRKIITMLGASCVLLGAQGGDSPTRPSLDEAWRDAGRMLAQDAFRRFEACPETRESKFGMAAALLNVQPKTRGNIDRAARLLEEVRKAEGGDELGVSAAFLLARLEQIHRFEPDPSKALLIYDQLLERHPEHPLAQMAAVKAAMIRLYDPDPSIDRRALFERIEKSGETLTDKDALRDFHELMANASALLGISDEKTLSHLLSAEKAGVAKRKTAADIQVRIGELARILGRDDVAIEHYSKFLSEFKRDNRSFLIQERLKSLQEGDAKKAEAVR